MMVWAVGRAFSKWVPPEPRLAFTPVSSNDGRLPAAVFRVAMPEVLSV